MPDRRLVLLLLLSWSMLACGGQAEWQDRWERDMAALSQQVHDMHRRLSEVGFEITEAQVTIQQLEAENERLRARLREAGLED